MCSACGVLGGGPEWFDRVGVRDGIGAAEGLTRAAERRHRILLVNRMLAGSGVRLAEFAGKFVVRGDTGRTRIVDDLAHVWLAADQIGRKAFDPLAFDPLAFDPLAGDGGDRPA
jgi:hypothetical protein